MHNEKLCVMTSTLPLVVVIVVVVVVVVAAIAVPIAIRTNIDDRLLLLFHRAFLFT